MTSNERDLLLKEVKEAIVASQEAIEKLLSVQLWLKRIVCDPITKAQHGDKAILVQSTNFTPATKQKGDPLTELLSTTTQEQRETLLKKLEGDIKK